MHILVCYMWYLRPDGAGIKRFNEFSRIWAEEKGVTVTVLTSMVDHNSGRIFQDLKGKSYCQESDGKVNVLRVSLPDTYSKGFAGRAFSQLTWASNARKRLGQVEKPDIVIGSSPPLWITTPAVAAKRKWNIPLIIEIRDLWPEMIVNLGVATAGHPGIKLLARHERWAYQQADRLVTVVPTQANNIAQRGLYDAGSIATITNGVMLEDYNDEAKSRRGEIRSLLGVTDQQKLVMYVGAHGRLNDLIRLVEVAEELKDRQDIRIVSIGDGPDREALAAETERRGLNNLRFAGPVKSADVPAYLFAADIGCSLVNTRDMTRYDNKTQGVFRNTFFDYAGAARPVVFNSPGFPVDEIENRAQGGFYASTDHGGKEVAEKIMYLADNPDVAINTGENNYREIAVRYNRRKMAGEYLKLMYEVIDGRNEGGRHN